MCGSPVAEMRPVAAARKVVTILFADLSGSTAFQERLDAEATRRVMDRVHWVLAEAVESQEGRVVKFTGDGMMAVFGIPQLRERRRVAGGASRDGDARDLREVRGSSSSVISGSKSVCGSGSTRAKWLCRTTVTMSSAIP